MSEERKPKPALGVKPYYIWAEERIADLMAAINALDGAEDGAHHRVVWAREVQLLLDLVEVLNEEKRRVYEKYF